MALERLEERRLLSASHGIDLQAMRSNISHELFAYADSSFTRPAGKVTEQARGADSPRLNDAVDLLTTDAEGNIAVRLTAKDVDRLLPLLQKTGFVSTGVRTDLHFVEGFVPPWELRCLAGLRRAGLMGVTPVYRPQIAVGAVTSQADVVLESNRVRNTLPAGYDGAGITVGVLSDSYNNLGGASDDVDSGDLPDDVNVLKDLGSGGTDEGRAMMQLVYDIAPGADLAFASAFFGEADFAQQIRNLADPAQGNADVIVDDVVYFAEPFFQDGVIAQAVDDVVINEGVAYYSSAGNQSTRAYESTTIDFAPDSAGLFSGSWYDFDASASVDSRQLITINDGQQFLPSFQWDDPFYTVDGVDTDLDIYLVKAGTTEVVAGSADDNITSATPHEIFGFTNDLATTGTTSFELMIHRFTGPEPGRMKYVNFGSDVVVNEFDTDSPTVSPHAGAANAMAVAAAFYGDQRTPESFTSHGPTTILFSPDGTRLTSPDVRQTPRITATDGTDTTFFGTDVDGNGFPNFFGTSAAAPHAAGVAALIKQANPSFTPAEINTRLESTALDLAAPGFDNVTGAGLINAYDAIFGPPVPGDLELTDGFETAVLSENWGTHSTGPGRILVRSDYGPNSGSYHMTMDTFAAFGFGRNEAILHVDTAWLTNVELSFAQKEAGDEDHPMSEFFSGSENSDGVAFSVDGVDWYRLVSLTGTNSTSSYQTHAFNLTDAAAAAGLALGSHVRVKFQQYDDFPLTSDGFAFDDVTIRADSTVTGRHVFYNNSAFDGNDAGIDTDPAGGFADASAVAIDKTALLPGGAASFANYTSYWRGTNGIMIDVAELASTVTTADFEFRVGNDNDPANWALAPPPAAVETLFGAGVGGTDRVVITWADGDIQKKWLQVTVLATANTDLAEPDVHYWGNAIGETGNSSSNAIVNGTDLVRIRDNPRSVFSPAAIDNVFDLNRDRLVNGTDMIIARDNPTSVFNDLELISPAATTGSTLSASNQSSAEWELAPEGEATPTSLAGDEALERRQTENEARLGHERWLATLDQLLAEDQWGEQLEARS